MTSFILSTLREEGKEHIESFNSAISFSILSLILDHSRVSGQLLVCKSEFLKRSRNESTFLAATYEGADQRVFCLLVVRRSKLEV